MEPTNAFNLSNRVFYLAFALTVAVALLALSQIFYQQRSLDIQNANQITVSGEGKVYAKPDIATVSLGLKTDGQDATAITQKNVTAMNTIIADLKKLGIDEKDIQTTQYSVTPQYNWTEKGGTVPNGYSISQDVSVKIRDFSKIGSVLSTASNDGANTVSGVQFSVDDMESVREQARAKAIAQAQSNAKNLASTSGIMLGRLINVQEGSSPMPVMYNAMDKASAMGGMATAPAPDIQPGQQEIDVTVNLTYQVK